MLIFSLNGLTVTTGGLSKSQGEHFRAAFYRQPLPVNITCYPILMPPLDYQRATWHSSHANGTPRHKHQVKQWRLSPSCYLPTRWSYTFIVQLLNWNKIPLANKTDKKWNVESREAHKPGRRRFMAACHWALCSGFIRQLCSINTGLQNTNLWEDACLLLVNDEVGSSADIYRLYASEGLGSRVHTEAN